MRRVFYFMGKAIITSRSGGIAVNNGSSAELQTEIFKANDTFIVPKARNQQFSVRIFGGGGGGYGSGGRSGSGGTTYPVSVGGGGGWMNNAVLTINQGEFVFITIGKGGKGSTRTTEATNGGTSSFGKYLYALGGTAASYTRGGFGGSGGGFESNSIHWSGDGGTGYQFGGGGGGGDGYGYGGNGGKWGGGGGGKHSTNQSDFPHGGCLYGNSQNMNEITGYSGLGGNGYARIRNGNSVTNGINTIGNSEVPETLQGPGLAGEMYTGGGGGYGGCGGNNGGGGGGYGGDGGNHGGGGGSYNKGGDGSPNPNFTGTVPTMDGVFGGGGGGNKNGGNSGNGGDGICIIQYYSA